MGRAIIPHPPPSSSIKPPTYFKPLPFALTEHEGPPARCTPPPPQGEACSFFIAFFCTFHRKNRNFNQKKSQSVWHPCCLCRATWGGWSAASVPAGTSLTGFIFAFFFAFDSAQLGARGIPSIMHARCYSMHLLKLLT